MTRGAGVLIGAAGALVLLLGLLAFVGPPGSDPAPSPSPLPTLAATLAPTPSSTPLPPETPGPGAFLLAGAGEIEACGAPGDADEATATLLDGLGGVVFTLGNHADATGTEAAFDDCYAASWGRHLARTVPAAGSWEHTTPGAAGYRASFGEAAGSPGETWHAHEFGAWQVLVLDSNCARLRGGCGPESPQVRWLDAQLAASQARCRLAIWHHPRFSSGERAGSTDVAIFWDRLHAAGTELVVNGRDRHFERFAPQDPAGVADTSGIRQFIVGTGGAPLGAIGDPAANSRVRASLSHGILVLTLEPAGFRWQFRSVDGAFADHGSSTCR